MVHSDFVHLHNHSEYSLLDGASRIDLMVDRAAAFKMPAIALTDHGNMFGAIEFYARASEQGVKVYLPSPSFCTDNAAMIGVLGTEYLKKGRRSPYSLNAFSSLPL